MPAKTQQSPKQAPPPNPSPLQRQVLFEWTAPERPFIKLDKQIFSTILAMAFLVGVILFFIEGVMPVITLIAILFLFYVLRTVPPKQVTHRLTNWGIESGKDRWPWENTVRYWFEGKDSSRMAVVELVTGFPRHIRLLFGDTKEEQLKAQLEKYLVYDRPHPNWLEKLEKWLRSKIKLAA